jgi:hypothetical protein
MFTPALRRFVLLTVGSAALFSSSSGQATEAQFAAPPDSARPHVFWHWMNGNVTEQGITLDLEAMQRVGIRGAQIYNAAPSIPAGPAKFMGPEWRHLCRFALQEAERLKMEIGFHNCAGWSSSGGPWMPVDQSMMELTWSETVVAGGKVIDEQLPEPPTRKGFYRDVACLAIPTQSSGPTSVREASPTVTLSLPGADGSKLVDGNIFTVLTGPSPSREKPQTVTFAFAQPYSAQTLDITPGPSFGGHGGILESSDDGQAYAKVCDFQIPDVGNAQTYLSQGFPPTTARYFRLTFNHSDFRHTPLSLAEIDLSPEFKLKGWRAKGGYLRENSPALDTRPTPLSAAIDLRREQNLTSQVTGGGRLKWQAPAGKWKVLRIGFTTKDKFNKPAGPEAVGYECDKMSKRALETFWSGMMQTLLNDNQELVGRSFHFALLDSFEVGTQNFTAEMPAEFERRCGYSLVPYLPALTGRVVGSIDVTERFLWDYRRVVADLWKENYFDHLNTLSNRSGLVFVGQPYGNGNFDSLSSGTGMDAPSTEFWVGEPRNLARHINVTSAAHLSGSSLVYSESFTAHPESGKWTNSPATVKTVGDLGFCDGVNAVIFHTYAAQPWVDASPGMTMGPYGIHFNRGNTWWESIGPWMDYLSRCQYMLRQGRTAADVLYFSGENSPVNATTLMDCPEYHVDYIDRFNLPRLTVKDGVLQSPSGMRYRILMLPNEPRGFSLPVLRAIQRLVKDGAAVVGSKPGRTPSLQGYPASEQTARQIAEEVWGSGRVLANPSALAVLRRLGIPPDCTSDQGGPAERQFAYIHRITDDADYYFVSNQTKRPLDRVFQFRVVGRRAEFWNPLNGKIADAQTVGVSSTQTAVRLSLPASGSMFVVFRRAAGGNGPENLRRRSLALVPDGKRSAPALAELAPPSWKVSFGKKVVEFDRLMSWPEQADPDVKYFSGTATYETHFNVTPEFIRAAAGRTIRLDLGRVEVIANVELNGSKLGIVWTPPFACDVSTALQAGDNVLKVEVTNLWPNRLIGDQEKGDPRHWGSRGEPLQWPAKLDANTLPVFSNGLHWMTWRHYLKGDPLLPSGLLGPVRLEIRDVSQQAD